MARIRDRLAKADREAAYAVQDQIKGSVVAARFEFEGEQLTVAEIKAIVPVISRAVIYQHLRRGLNTRQKMLTFNGPGAVLAGARRGRKACGNKLYTGVEK